jgi:hypothetical protein
MQRIRGVEAVRRGQHALGPRISNAKCFEPELARDVKRSKTKIRARFMSACLAQTCGRPMFLGCCAREGNVPACKRSSSVSRRGGAEISGHRCGGHYSDGCVPHAERWLFFSLDHYPGYLVKRDATRWSIEQPPELARGKSFWVGDVKTGGSLNSRDQLGTCPNLDRAAHASKTRRAHDAGARCVEVGSRNRSVGGRGAIAARTNARFRPLKASDLSRPGQFLLPVLAGT